MPISSDNGAQVRKLFDSTGDRVDSRIPEDSGKSRVAKYEDEIQRIKDAIADSDWYAEEEPVNEDEYDLPTGNLTIRYKS